MHYHVGTVGTAARDLGEYVYVRLDMPEFDSLEQAQKTAEALDYAVFPYSRHRTFECSSSRCPSAVTLYPEVSFRISNRIFSQGSLNHLYTLRENLREDIEVSRSIFPQVNPALILEQAKALHRREPSWSLDHVLEITIAWNGVHDSLLEANGQVRIIAKSGEDVLDKFLRLVAEALPPTFCPDEPYPQRVNEYSKSRNRTSADIEGMLDESIMLSNRNGATHG